MLNNSLWPYVISTVIQRYIFQDGSNGWHRWILLEFSAIFRTSAPVLRSPFCSPFPSLGCLSSPECALFGQWLQPQELLYRLNIAATHNTHNLFPLRAYYPLLHRLVSPFIVRNLYCLIISLSKVMTPLSSGSPFAALNNGSSFLAFCRSFASTHLPFPCPVQVWSLGLRYTLGSCRMQRGEFTSVRRLEF